MIKSPVLISGAGIGGLSVALTLQQIGVPCRVFESAADLKPLGVGIDLQPNAMRELYELGLGPTMLRGASDVYEYPMIDRDPVPTWRDGNAALLGDAAHVMYPTGSNGASQAIVDARVLGAAMLQCGVNARALQAYDERLRPALSPLILRNRGAGPFGLLNLLDERCGGVFDDIDAIIPKAERDEFMHRYKVAAGACWRCVRASPASSTWRSAATVCTTRAVGI